MPRTQNLVGERFGKLTVLEKLPEKEDRYATWRCKCDCGGEIVVNTKRLLRGTITNCGCIPKKNACFGTELELSEDALVHGHYVSCGCQKQEIQESIPEQLTFVDGTCLEWLDKRKHRVDNTSGFRGVKQTKNGKWKAMIGLQSRRYYLGTFATMSEAVAVRLEAEQLLHDGLVEAYRRYAVQAEKDPEWTEQNPFYFRVARINGDFCIRTTEIPEETEAAL